MDRDMYGPSALSKLVPKDCGYHYCKKGGTCEKCKDPQIAIEAQRRLRERARYSY